jgi:hypothetical protein
MQAMTPLTQGGMSQLRSDPFVITSHRSRNLVSLYARDEFHLAAAAQNLRKMAKLLGAGQLAMV